MLLLSWNVAGLSKTVQRIDEAYGSDSRVTSKTAASKRKAAPSASLLYYFEKHKADVVCLQEHKIPLSQLSARSEPRGCSTVEGYESFWSCCIGKSQRGFNGVCTYARKGMVISANSSPLGDKELDDQGRCVMVDLMLKEEGDLNGTIVALFNVYVPAMGGQSLSFRMKFLRALRRAMRYQREVLKKKIILVGDLNIAHTSRDRYWKSRTLHVNNVLNEVAQKQQEVLPKWKGDLATSWNKIESCMETKEVVSTKTTNTLTGAKYDKFRLCVTVDNRRVFLGRHESCSNHCRWQYEFGQCTYLDSDTDQELPACAENTLSVGILAELMAKIAGVTWSETTLRAIADTDAGVADSPSVRWLDEVTEKDNMVDSFRFFYPTAEGRFTCWDQFTNRRYSNEGIRLDYTLVDRSLLPFVEKGDVSSLRCCGLVADDPLSEAAALVAATANGRFKPVSFEGEGIVEASREALDTQFGTPHSGIVYTPPSFSDHVAVTVLFKDSTFRQDLALDEMDHKTKKAQPHKSQKSISSFFTSNNGTGIVATTQSKPNVDKNLKRINFGEKARQGSSIASYFAQGRDSSIDSQQSTKRPKLVPTRQKSKTMATKQAKNRKSSILHHFLKECM